MKIDVHIERLALDGVSVPPGQGHRLQTSVEVELTRVLANRGVPSKFAVGGDLPQAFGSGIRLAGGDDIAQLGGQIAKSVHGGIAE